MNIWIDTEFNSFGGRLISMALVDEAGETFYECLECPQPHPWVATNVIPVLNKPNVPVVMFRYYLKDYLAKYETVHLIADWPEDISYFCNALITGPGMRLDTPPLTLEIKRIDSGHLSKIPHNALSDAIALREFDLGHETN